MTIEERTADILKFHKMDSKDLFEMKKLLDQYVSLFKDNIEVQIIFLDPGVSYHYIDGVITPNHLMSYLRFANNFGNKLNLSNEDFLIDAKNSYELITTCFRKYDYLGGFKTTIVSDSNLLNKFCKLFISIQPYEHIPFLLKKLIVVSIYKNINLLGYKIEDDCDKFYDNLYFFYISVLCDDYIIEFLKNNNINDNNIYNCDPNILFNLLDDYIIIKMNKGERKIITR